MTELYPYSAPPKAQGLYEPSQEHDGCGIGFVANISGAKSHDIVLKGVQILENLVHRGACGCDPQTGDGAGILIQIPHSFFERECAELNFALPAVGAYGVGMTFLPVDPHERIQCEGMLEKIVIEEGLSLLGWRDTPINGNMIGRVARNSQPYIEQIFIGAAPEMDQDALERKLYVVRKRAEHEIAASDLKEKDFFYIPSLSSRTIVYKGLLLAPQITEFYKELLDPEIISGLCLVHQRFSTNTFPSWQLAHPYRYICHNGEINTLRGNINWMYARQSILASPLFGEDFQKLLPIIEAGRKRLRDTRQRGGAAHARGPQPAARDVHAHSGSLGPRFHHARECEGLLRISRFADGAVGRPRGGGLHRRARNRREARPQRAPPGPLFRHQRRLGRDGLGSGRAPGKT